MAVRPVATIEECAREPDFAALDRAALEAMARAGRDVHEVERVLARTGDNVVGEIIKGAETFYEWNHYPDGDVYDAETGSQFFYHAHPADLRAGEHGHFHAFLRPAGMPDGVRPAEVADLAMPEDENDALSHLIGISMDSYGAPVCLFTTNRWVTGEIWYDGADVVRMLDRFEIGHARPSWPVNRWIGAMIRLFRPQIELLLAERDATVAAWDAEHAYPRNALASGAGDVATSVFEDRELEVTSFKAISVARQVARIDEALAGR